MNKKYICGLFLGIAMYIVLHDFFDVSKIITLPISLFIAYILLNYLKVYKLKIKLNNLNQFVDVTNQSIEKMIKEQKEFRNYIHDMKNHLFFIKELFQKKEYKKMEEEIDNCLLECTKFSPSSICTNVYIDFFLGKFIESYPQMEYDIKIDVPENINMKAMDLSSFILCLLQDDLIKETGKLIFHIYANKNELITNVVYPNKIKKVDDNAQSILSILIKKYHGDINIVDNQMRCILFLD